MGQTCDETRERKGERERPIKHDTIWLTFQWFGKGEIKDWEYLDAKLEKHLVKAIGEIGVKFSEIEEVTYQYMPVNCKKTLRELEIENGGILIIKLKPSF